VRHRLQALLSIFGAIGLAVWLGHHPSSVSVAVPIEQTPAVSVRSNYVLGSYLTTIATDVITIPTYSYAAALFTTTNSIYNIPYQWLHWADYGNTGPTRDDQRTYQILVLENEWLQVWLLPEVGGRIYQIVDKSTGHGLLYRNQVLKPTHWGPTEQGWWLAAGGIEWGLPVEEHGYEWGIPWSYDILTGTSGITVTLRDSTEPDRLRAAVSVFLPNDRAVLLIQPRLENDRSLDLNFKWWINAMIAPGPDNTVGTAYHDTARSNVRFIYPGDQVTIHSTGDNSLPGENNPSGPYLAMPWPIYNTRDLSYLKNWNQYIGFFMRPAASSDFAAVYDVNNAEGLARIFPHTVATGLKAFGMGWQNALPWELWSDSSDYYVELHGGLAPTFWDSAFLPAKSSIAWTETWYPIAGLKNLTTGTDEAALQVESDGSTLSLGVFATRPRTQTRLAVYQHSTCQALADYAFSSIDPAAPITRALTSSVPLADVSVLYSAGTTPLATYNLSNDGHAPLTSIEPLPVYETQATFPITLTGSDPDCLQSYDAEYKAGLDGAWTPWLTATTQAVNLFSGQHGQTYFFRTRARDLAGNLGAYQSDRWGQAHTSVVLTPTAIFELSNKTTLLFFRSDQPIEYTIELSNTGNLAGFVTLTDSLPLSTTLIPETLIADSPITPTFSGGLIHWSGSISSLQTVHLQYAITAPIDLPIHSILTNTVQIEGGGRLLTRSAITIRPYPIFLPIVLREATP
jgi:uncharacterized repeat protein (TIGR01451 family)